MTNDAVRYVIVKHPSGHTFVVLDIKDFQQLELCAGYEFHAQSEAANTIEEAFEQLAGEVDQERGRTQ